MTSRLRPATRPGRRFNLGDEDRRTFLVNAAFVAVIVGLVVLLVGAIAVTYWQDNLRPIARVGSLEIGPGLVADRADLLRLRIDREQRRLRTAITDGELDQVTAAQRAQELAAQLEELDAQAEEGLIDLIFQTQLATERGINVSAADIDARQAEQLAGSERRHVFQIVVEPEVADEDVGVTYAERSAARERAEAALAELQAGAPFAEVVAEYSTDPSKQNGGDMGFVSSANSLDATFLDALFDLEATGTTDVVRTADSSYRIGVVTEIREAGPEAGFLDDVLERMSLERYREFLGWEVAADRLRDSITDEVLGQAVEQVRLSHIRIDAAEDTGDDTEGQGEVHYSEIVYAPNDSIEDAPELDEEDPAWEAARVEADDTYAELSAITDPVERLARFRGIAGDESDSSLSAAEDGDAGFATRGLLPEEIGVALFDSEHENDTLLAPVRAEGGYYLLWFHEHRPSPAERLAEVQAALALPGADFAALAKQYSDDEQSRDIGGDIGWWTRAMLEQVDADLANGVYAVAQGGISEPQELGNATHIFKIIEKVQRALDADQVWFLGDDAFDSWYSDRKDEAEANDVIVRAGEEDDPGIDVPTDSPTPAATTPAATTPAATTPAATTPAASPSASPTAVPTSPAASP